MSESDTPRVEPVLKLERNWAISMDGEVRLSRHTLISAVECPLYHEEETINFLCEELTAARAELAEIHATGGCSFKELHRLIEQRDRLAEALKSIASGAVYEDKCILIAREALQSLTTNASVEARKQ